MSHDEDPWAESAATWDTDPITNAYADAAFASLKHAVDVAPTMHVLDFGCGTGLLTERLSPHVGSLVGVDASPAMIEVLAGKALPNVRPVAATWTPRTIHTDPAASRPFDLIVCSSVLAFLEDYPGTVAMLAEHLAPGGTLVQWDWALNPDDAEPFGLTEATIRAALEGAGLEVRAVGIGFEVPLEGTVMRPLMGVGQRRR